MRDHKFASVLLAAALLAPWPGRALAGAGLTGAPILDRPVGARSSAMGRAFTAVPGEAESVMYNPAGTAFVPVNTLYLGYMNGFAGGRYGFAAVPFRLGRFTLTPAYLYYNSGKMDLNLSNGVTGSVTAELDQVVMFSAACVPLKALAVGGTVKFTGISLAGTASASVRHFDLGALYAATERLSFGAASLNNGDAVKFEEKSAPAPAALRAGLAYKLDITPDFPENPDDNPSRDLVLTGDWSRTAEEKGYYQAGIEMNMETLSLRAGYLFGRPEENITLGFGVRRATWTFSFGYEAAGDLDARLPVSFSCKF